MQLKTLFLMMILVVITLGCTRNNGYYISNGQYIYCTPDLECDFGQKYCCQSCVLLTADSLDSKVFKTSMFNEYINVGYIDLPNVGIMEIANEDPLRLNDLKIIDISYNNITDLKTNCIESSSLKELCLQGNQISHIEINAFNKMPSLELLYLSHNELTNLNLTLMHLDKLKTLKLSFNRIAELDRQDFKGAVSLQKVEISHLHFSDPISE